MMMRVLDWLRMLIVGLFRLFASPHNRREVVYFMKSAGGDVKIDVVNENERLVGGWASVTVVDRQGDYVDLQSLTKAMIKFMDRGGLVNFEHSNKPIGKVVYWDIKDHPAGGKGLYVIVKINSGYKMDDVVWNKIKLGELKGFSIAGFGGVEKRKMKENGEEKEVNVLKDIELNEISIVANPANPLALIDQVSFAKSLLNVRALKEFGVDETVFVRKLEEISKCGFTKALEDVFADDVAMAVVGKGYAELSDVEAERVERVFELMRRMIAVRESVIGSDVRKSEGCVKCVEKKEEKKVETKKVVKSDKRIVTASQEVVMKALKLKGIDLDELVKGLVEFRKPEDVRPPKEWWERCVERVRGKVSDPERLCGWVYYHHLKPEGSEEDEPATREARERKREWLSRGGE